MNSQQKENIAKKLRMLRAEYNLTQSDVANKLGITQQTYSKYENQSANLDSDIIVKLCELYGVSSDYLLGIKEAPKAAKKEKTVAYKASEDEIKTIVKKVLSEINKNQ